MLDVHLTEFGLTYVDKFAGISNFLAFPTYINFLGSCNCSNGNIELFVYPQGGTCNNAVPYGHVRMHLKLNK